MFERAFQLVREFSSYSVHAIEKERIGFIRGDDSNDSELESNCVRVWILRLDLPFRPSCLTASPTNLLYWMRESQGTHLVRVHVKCYLSIQSLSLYHNSYCGLMGQSNFTVWIPCKKYWPSITHFLYIILSGKMFRYIGSLLQD